MTIESARRDGPVACLHVRGGDKTHMSWL